MNDGDENLKDHLIELTEAQIKRDKKGYLPVYFTEAHKKNSETAMEYIAKSKTSKIDWDKELVRLKENSKDHLPDTK